MAVVSTKRSRRPVSCAGWVVRYLSASEKETSPLSREQYAALYRQFEAIGRIGERHGIRAAFHYHRGCLETEVEVHAFFAHTRAVWFAPDLGHAAALGWTPLPVLREYRDKVVHVHLKDAWRDPATGGFVRFVQLARGNCGLDIKARRPQALSPPPRA